MVSVIISGIFDIYVDLGAGKASTLVMLKPYIYVSIFESK